MEWLIINIIESILLVWFISSLVDIKNNQFLYRLLLVISNFIAITTSNYLSMYDVFLTTIIIGLNVFISYWFVYNSILELLFICSFEAVFGCLIACISVFGTSIWGIENISFMQQIIYLIGVLLSKKLLRLNQMHFSKEILIILTLIFYSMHFVLQHFLQVYLVLRDDLPEIILTFIMMFLCIIILFILLFRISHMYKDQKDYKILKQKKENEQSLTFLYDQLKITKHDLKHDYDLLDYYINNKDEEKIRSFIKDKKSIVGSMPTLICCKNELVNIIINNKMIQAYMKGIEVNCDISVNEDINICDYDLNNLLSNILDNAIENCSNHGKISINIFQDNIYLHIKVTNTLDSKAYLPDLKTKKDKKDHGFGLKSIRNITRFYDGIMNTEKIKETFQIKITLLIK